MDGGPGRPEVERNRRKTLAIQPDHPYLTLVYCSAKLVESAAFC
jgi:hypothetical protein